MLCGYDCHSHVARALNVYRYAGCAMWNKLVLALWVFVLGTHVSMEAAARVWLPPVLLLCFLVLLHALGGL